MRRVRNDQEACLGAPEVIENCKGHVQITVSLSQACKRNWLTGLTVVSYPVRRSM